jgi:hypothetical protein
MFCKDDRCEEWLGNFPPIEIGGFKMLDVAHPENIGVIRAQFFISYKFN